MEVSGYFTPQLLYPWRNSLPIPTDQENGWAPETVHTFEAKNYLLLQESNYDSSVVGPIP
jgi:hypothetical protein